MANFKKRSFNPIGSYAKREIGWLKLFDTLDFMGNIIVGFGPSAAVIWLLADSLSKIAHVSLLDSLKKTAMYDPLYQTWYIGILTIFVASWTVFTVRLPILAEKAAQRRDLKNHILSAELSAQNLMWNYIGIYGDKSSSLPISAGIFDETKLYSVIPARYEISVPIYEVQQAYFNLKEMLIRYQADKSPNASLEARINLSIDELHKAVCNLLTPYDKPSDGGKILKGLAAWQPSRVEPLNRE